MEAASPFRFLAASEAETARLGAVFADSLQPGSVVTLVGTLGAGKTRLVRAVAEAAGVDRRAIGSPTFVLVHEYAGRWPIYHFDAYRLPGVQEFVDLGALEYFASDGICFVEWADRIAEALPDDHVRIEITPTGEASREFVFVAHGPKSAAIVAHVADRLAGNQGAPSCGA